jgi:hypothetical protein
MILTICLISAIQRAVEEFDDWIAEPGITSAYADFAVLTSALDS